MGAQMVKEVASKTSDVAGDGTTTATVLAQAIFSEGLEERRRRRQPDGDEARHREGRRGRRSTSSKKHVEADQRQRGDRPGRHDLRQQRRDDRQDDRRGDGEGRQGRRHHRRRSQDARDRRSRWSRACSSTAATSRRTSSPIRSAWKCVLEDAYILIHEKKISSDEGPAAGARAGRADGQAAADHRRGRRRRSAGDAGRQQAARHAATCAP